MDLRQCTQALIYEGAGNLLLGSIDKFAITDGRKATTVEHKTLGQVGVLELPGRPQAAIKGKITSPTLIEGMDRTLISPTRLHDWQMHKKIDVSDEAGFSEEKSHTVIWHAKFRTIGDDGITAELGEKDGVEYEVTVPYLRIFVEGQNTPIWFLDVFNNVFQVNGRDVWPR